MKIDSKVEPLVRNAIHAAVVRDSAMLEDKLGKLGDDETTRKAVELTLALVGVLFVDLYQGRPTDSQVREAAEHIARTESWAELDQGEMSEFASRLVAGEPLAGVIAPEGVIIMGFVAAGHLLAGGRRDDEKWYSYLDRAEAALEAA